MIVIAIVGILASISIPAYRTYIVRSYITEVIALGDSMRTQIEEIYSSTGQLPCCSTGAFADCDCSGWSPVATAKGPKDVNNPNPHVSLMRWYSRSGGTAGGRIELNFSNTAPAEIANTLPITSNSLGIALVAIPPSSASSSLQWSCGSYNNYPAVIPYLPSTCRAVSTW